MQGVSGREKARVGCGVKDEAGVCGLERTVRKSNLGTENNFCKGPEAAACLDYI